ncbi:MAG TPA: nucleotidyltransferase family protein [Nitrososphaerales archaeon]|nr:nucleotidyltransferase family protein [Nitrososphaerales archaeon]
MPDRPKALVLAGGLGTRLQPYTFFVPKPMLPLADRPLLEHLLAWLKKNGVGQVVLSVSYLRNVIENYFENGNGHGLAITYVRSKSPLGIGGQILNAKPELTSTFYLLYGDSVFDFNLQKMLRFHRESKASLTLGVMRYAQKMKYGIIEREKDGRVTSWKEKPEIGGLINVGCYVAEPALFKYIPRGKMYGFDEVVRDLMKDGERVFSYVIEGKEFIDIGDEKSYRAAYELYLKKLGTVL